MNKAKEILDKYGREWFNETDDLDDESTGYVTYGNALKAVNEALNKVELPDNCINEDSGQKICFESNKCKKCASNE